MKKLVGMVVALAVGAGLGYALKPAPEPAAAETPHAAKRAKGTIAEAGEHGTVKALQKRIAALERELAAARTAAASAPTSAAQRVEAPARHGPGDFREHLKKLEKEDPAKYAQITNRFARFRQRRLDRAQGRLDFLASIDVSSLGAKASKVHADLQKAIVDREALEERLHDLNLSEEERRKLMGQMFAADRETRRLASEERGNLLKLTAESLGLAGDDAQALVDTVKDVVESTETHGGMPPPGPPPGEGGPRP